MSSINNSSINNRNKSLSIPETASAAGNKKYSNEIEETITRIRSHKGVEGIMVLSREGWTIYSTFDEEQTATHSALISQLTSKASHVVDALDTNDELTFLRVRSRHREIMVAPDKEYLLVVLQNPHAGALDKL